MLPGSNWSAHRGGGNHFPKKGLVIGGIGGIGLVEQIMTAVYANKKLKDCRYLHAGLNIIRITKSVFLSLLPHT